MNVIRLGTELLAQVGQHLDLRTAHCIGAECRAGEHHHGRLTVGYRIRYGSLIQQGIVHRSRREFRNVVHVRQRAIRCPRRYLADVYRLGPVCHRHDDLDELDIAGRPRQSRLDSPCSRFGEIDRGNMYTSPAVRERLETRSHRLRRLGPRTGIVNRAVISVSSELHKRQRHNTVVVRNHHCESPRTRCQIRCGQNDVQLFALGVHPPVRLGFRQRVLGGCCD